MRRRSVEAEALIERRAEDAMILDMAKYRLLPTCIDDFLDDGTRRGWSSRTTTTYRRILDDLCDRMPVDATIDEVSEEVIRRYLQSKKGKARGTIAHTESVLSSFLRWCYLNGRVKANPMDRIARTRRINAAELDVVTVSTEDVPKLLAAAEALDVAAGPAYYGGHDDRREVWTHRVCLGILCYVGPRRRAVSRLRLRDYDARNGRLRFREKGGKIIWKPVPTALARIIDAAREAGAIEKPADFLVPPLPEANYAPAVLAGKEERDDRCIWLIVKRVGAKAGVETHVHALRAAFAVHYLEMNPGDVEGLRQLMGHSTLATTQIYLRKLDKDRAMEPVRGFEWGEAA